MSHQFGACYWDGRPADTLQDAPRFQSLGSAALAHHEPGLWMVAARSAGPGRSGVENPLTVSTRGNACTWDGRLDNRADLLRRGGLGEDASDALVALSVYESNGVEGLDCIIGDWSLVIWDRLSREIVLASDFAGIRPLYYQRTGQRVVWSSSLDQLAAWAGSTELDEDYAADFLARGSAPGRTPYKDIYPAPNGSGIRISQQRAVARRFWYPPLGRPIRYRGEADYEEHLRSVFEGAVQSRLQTTGPVCAELSGGLDSSSIVCMAHRLVEARKAEAPQLYTFTYSNPGSPDEPFQRAVENACGGAGIHMDLQGHPYLAPGQVGRASPAVWEPRLKAVLERMDRLGSSVFLTGQMGDLVMGNWMDDSEQVAERFREGQIAAGLRQALAWSQSLRVPVYSIVWRGLTNCLREWKPAQNVDLRGTLADGSSGTAVLPRFHERAIALEAARTKTALWRKAAPSRRKHLWALANFLDTRALQCPEIMQGVSYSHPYAHRPLVEFMMSIPAEIVCRPGRPRSLMRSAFAEFLPASVVRRRSKATFDTAFRAALTALAREVLVDAKNMQLAERGYVDAATAESHLKRYVEGLKCNEGEIRHLLLFEFWLRAWQHERHGQVQAGQQPQRQVMHAAAGKDAASSKF